MKRGYTHISVIIDKSGSMGSTRTDTIGGFNTFLNEQQDLDGTGTLTLVQFDDQYEVHENMSPLESAKDLTSKTYAPRGSTALLDAIGKTINTTESKLKELDEEDQPEKVIFLIITDGFENSSHEFSKSNISEMVKRHEEEDEWDFVFIGANMDAISEGGSMGLRAGNTANYCASSIGTKSLYRSVSDNMTTYRSRKGNDKKIGFFEEDTIKDIVENTDEK
jgi:uncharacterized protein YegL